MFGLLRQRKLDFLDIYSDEMILAAKAVVAQVWIRTRKDYVCLINKHQNHPQNPYLLDLLFWTRFFQCVSEGVLHMEEIDPEVVTK